MINTLANLRIGRKLTLLLAAGLGPALSVAALALWGLSAIHQAIDQEQACADKMMIAQHAAADMGWGTSIVGHIALGSHCETCHGVATGGDREHQAKLVKVYLSQVSDLKAAEAEGEGRRLVGELETAALRWHEINSRVLEWSHKGKRKESIEAYRSESIPGYAPVDQALQTHLLQFAMQSGRNLLIPHKAMPLTAKS
jgi:hypothetical protein